jgi:sugar lactone lactonase YvrE
VVGNSSKLNILYQTPHKSLAKITAIGYSSILQIFTIQLNFSGGRMKLKNICLFFLFQFFFIPQLNAFVGDAVKNFPTPGMHPAGMTFDGQFLWLADHQTARLDQIDPHSGKVRRSLPAPGFDPRGLAWDGKLLWCVDAGESRLYGINVQTGIAEKTLESYSPAPAGLAFDGQFLWLVDNQAQRILKINRTDGMMHENIPTPSDKSQGLTFDGNYLWVADPGENMLFRVDPANGMVVTIIPAPGPYPSALAWDGQTLWLTDYQKCQILQLNLADPEFVQRKNPKIYQWEAVHDFRNYGPDTVPLLDIYLAIPRDFDNQELLGKVSFDPQPTHWVTDHWGQPFAHFQFKEVLPGTRLLPKMKVKVKKYHTTYSIFPERVGALSEIPAEIREKYLVDGIKFDIQHPQIQQAVAAALGQEQRPFWMMRKIFDYICEKIEYNLKPMGGWNPAPTVLERGTGSCSEYTFIFISMCRASGLPARYAGSLVIRDEDRGIDDVWHRWAEVYLPNYGWIPVDVSAGDQPSPGSRAQTIGVLRNRYLITTKGGGDSEYLDFYYNFNEKWQTKGKCKVFSKQYGEFIPVE